MAVNIGTGPQLAKGRQDLQRLPKLTFLKKDPIAKAVTDKLFVDTKHGRGKKGIGSRHAPHGGIQERISAHTTQNITDNNNIRQLLPDTELAKQILVSSILSPNDLVNVELGYRMRNDTLESEMTGPLLEIIKDHFTSTYNITRLLPKILEECLFEKGAYPLLILPESSIDDIINSPQPAMESLQGELAADGKPHRSVGILGPSTEATRHTFSMENYSGAVRRLSNTDCEVKSPRGDFKPHVDVTDNLAILKFPQVTKTLRERRVKDIMGRGGFGFESRSGRVQRRRKTVTDQEVVDATYQEREYKKEPFIHVKTTHQLEQKTRGEPMVMKLPVESVIPVHVPSNPDDHVGYFVLLDQLGNPVSKAQESDYYRDLTNKVGTDATSQLISSARQNILGYEVDNKKLTEMEATRLYADIVEGDLINRLRNGVYGDSVEISRPLNVYRVMLARALSNKGTQVLYIPIELMTYFAFDYNQFGVGKSLLDDNKILANLRSMLLFSNTMAAIKNSTGRTGLRIDLDPDDPDPATTVEYLVHEYTKNRQRSYPLGASNPLDIVDFLQNANVDVQVQGNSDYPETKLEVEDMASNKVNVDSDLEDDIKRKYFMSLGLSPETIDLASDVEFATSIVTSNLLLAKRVMMYQDIYTPLLVDFIGKYVENSSPLYEKLLEAISNNKTNLSKEHKQLSDETVLSMFLDNLEVTLPRPDTAKLENQMESFRLYTESLELAVDAYFGEDAFMLREFDDVEENIRAVRSAVIAYYQREWLRKNNVMSELVDLVTLADNGEPEMDLNEIHGNHMEVVGKSIADLIERMRKDRERRMKQLEEKEAESNPVPERDTGTQSLFGEEPPTDDDTDTDEEGDEENEVEDDDTDEEDTEPNEEGDEDALDEDDTTE